MLCSKETHQTVAEEKALAAKVGNGVRKRKTGCCVRTVEGEFLPVGGGCVHSWFCLEGPKEGQYQEQTQRHCRTVGMLAFVECRLVIIFHPPQCVQGCPIQLGEFIESLHQRPEGCADRAPLVVPLRWTSDSFDEAP